MSCVTFMTDRKMRCCNFFLYFHSLTFADKKTQTLLNNQGLCDFEHTGTDTTEVRSVLKSSDFKDVFLIFRLDKEDHYGEI